MEYDQSMSDGSSWADMITDERLHNLVSAVWQRLPAYDREALLDLIFEVNETDFGGLEEAFAYTGDQLPSRASSLDANEIAASVQPIVWLGRVKDIASDAAAMYVIAHEFAHNILRHPHMGAVVARLAPLGEQSPYTVDAIEAMTAWEEDAAALQVYAWGFGEEMAACFKTDPEAKRPRWWME